MEPPVDVEQFKQQGNVGSQAMDVNQIIYFLTLCEELHFTRAAKRCGISQPSLTNAIRALEQEFGGKLLHRKPKPRLSQLGQHAQAHLRLALTHVLLAVSRPKRDPLRARNRAGNARRRALHNFIEEHRAGSSAHATSLKRSARRPSPPSVAPALP